jgi:3-methyladenine DNA glycosylase AlkD
MDIDTLKSLFNNASNAEKAGKMSSYMKNQFLYLGIQKPERAALEKAFIKANNKRSYTELKETILTLWNQPEREFQYTAMELMIKSKIWNHAEAITLFETCVLEKSWWDTVDLLSSRMIGPYFQQFPEQRDVYIERWLNGDNMWLQRTCIIFQLNYKSATDVALLFACITKHMDSKAFFIRKAIGWALRQYARTNSEAVTQFVNSHPLSPLSRREALKHFKDA